MVIIQLTKWQCDITNWVWLIFVNISVRLSEGKQSDPHCCQYCQYCQYWTLLNTPSFLCSVLCSLKSMYYSIRAFGKKRWALSLSLSVSLQHLEYSIGTAFVSIAGIAWVTDCCDRRIVYSNFGSFVLIDSFIKLKTKTKVSYLNWSPHVLSSSVASNRSIIVKMFGLSFGRSLCADCAFSCALFVSNYGSVMPIRENPPSIETHI